MKEGIKTAPLSTNEPFLTTALGTTLNPALSKSFFFQPSNLDGTLSHQNAFPGPDEISF